MSKLLKGIKNIFIGEDESDEIEFSAGYGQPNMSRPQKPKINEFDFDDMSGAEYTYGAGAARAQRRGFPDNDMYDNAYSDPRKKSFVNDTFNDNSDADTAFSSSSSASGYNNYQEDERKMNTDQMQTLAIVLARPVDFSEVRSIGDDINAYKTVILNLEMVKSDDAKRILDFLSGVAYANKATIKMMAQKTFAIMSKNVKFDGKDLMTELENNGYSF